ncbi:MAG: amidohydrolase [Rhodothalassiaceae bacterium]
MRIVLAVAVAAYLSGSALADGLSKAVEADYDYLFDLYRHFHANPELSYREEKTAARLAAELKALGFEVTEKFGRYKGRPDLTSHGLVAVMENGQGPTLLIRADMDGLPVEEKTGVSYASRARQVDDDGEEKFVMHACAHDTHMTIQVGTARRLVEMKDQWRGTLVLVGQPAEERIGGAKAMIDAGLFKTFPTPDYNLALHTTGSLPSGHIAMVSGPALASSDSVDITIYGIGGHGAYPHGTKDPVALAAYIITGLQTIVSRETDPLDSAVVTVGSIHGGTKHNIISDRVDLQLTIRTFKEETRQRVLDSIERIAVNQARAFGLPDDKLPKVELHGGEGVGPTVNDPVLTARIMDTLADRFGRDRIITATPVMGAEDFSEFGKTEEDIPSLIFWVGGADPAKFREARARGQSLPSNHSPLFVPQPEPVLTMGVEAMTTAALELLGKPQAGN